MLERLSETDDAIKWLRQFAVPDQSTMLALLDAIVLVSRDEFFERLRQRVLSAAAGVDGIVGLYAEREIRKRHGVPNRLFGEKFIRKVRRAVGPGPKPVQPSRTLNPEVGSEALVAYLITQLCRAGRDKFRSHPGPDQIRRESIRAFFLISDFIGSGSRVTAYLDAAWRTASVKSWRSLGLMRFEVIAYSATELGLRRIQAHRSKPKVSIVVPCPTLR